MRQVSLIIILSRLICHHRLREIRCELLLDWQSWLPRVPCSCNAHLCTIFKLPSWHCNPINPPPPLRPASPPIRTQTCSCTHPHRCVHVQGWYTSPLPPLCPCTVVGPTDQHAPPVWISIPGARCSDMYSLLPESRLVTSRARSMLRLTYVAHVHLQQTPAHLKELIHRVTYIDVLMDPQSIPTE